MSFLLALQAHLEEKQLAQALDAIVAAYYGEYTDATEMDGEFQSALRHIFDTIFPGGELPDGRDFDQLIARQE